MWEQTARAPTTQAGAAPVQQNSDRQKEFHPMKFRPLHDRVLAQRVEEGEEKVGGIIIPDTAKEKPQRAKVVAVGDGKILKDGKRAALDVKPGDEVLVGKWSGTEVKIDGEEYLVLREDEILAVLG
jgi:chaperonin GroES